MAALKTLTLRLLSAEVCEITLHGGETIDDLKLRIMDRTGISPSCQRLVCSNNGILKSGAYKLLDVFLDLDHAEITLVQVRTTFVGSSPGLTLSDDGRLAQVSRMTTGTFWSSVWTDVVKCGTFALDLRFGAFGDIQNYVISIATARGVEALKTWSLKTWAKGIDMWNDPDDFIRCLRFKMHRHERICEHEPSASIVLGPNDVVSIEVDVDEKQIRFAINGSWMPTRFSLGESLRGPQGFAAVVSLSTTRCDRHVSLCNMSELRTPIQSVSYPGKA